MSASFLLSATAVVALLLDFKVAPNPAAKPKPVPTAPTQPAAAPAPATPAATEGAKQSPENAQVFLKNVLEGVKFTDNRAYQWHGRDDSIDGRTFDSSGKTYYGPSESSLRRINRELKSFQLIGMQQGVDVCESLISIQWDVVYSFQPGLWWSHVPSQYQPSSPTLPARDVQRRSGGKRVAEFSWKYVSAARADGADVIVTTQNYLGNSGSGEVAFHLEDDEIATRTAYAIEYLRLHCDRNNATGF